MKDLIKKSFLNLTLIATLSMAAEHQHHVKWTDSQSSKPYAGKIYGYGYDAYRFNGKKGQILLINSNSPVDFSTFYLDDVAIPSMTGQSIELPATGEYEVRVLQMRNAARKNETKTYEAIFTLINATDEQTSTSNKKQSPTTSRWYVGYECNDGGTVAVDYRTPASGTPVATVHFDGKQYHLRQKSSSSEKTRYANKNYYIELATSKDAPSQAKLLHFSRLTGTSTQKVIRKNCTPVN